MIASGDYVKVKGTVYMPPPEATKTSCYLAMFPVDENLLGDEEKAPDKKLVKIRTLRKRAKGVVDVSYIGQVTRIVDGIAVIQSRGNIEHAKVDDCEKIRICKMCYREEAEPNSEFCRKSKCAKKRHR